MTKQEGLKQNTYKGYPLMGEYNSNNQEYLDSLRLVLEKAVENHSPTLAVRLDLRFPQSVRLPEDNLVIEQFFAYLKTYINENTYQRNKARGCDPVPESELGYVWLMQCRHSYNQHYHVVIFVNHKTFNTLDDCCEEKREGDEWGDLAGLVRRAWANALSRPLFVAEQVVSFTRNSTYWLNAGMEGYYECVRHDLFRKLSYLPESPAKPNGAGNDSFGCSEK